MPSKLQNLKTKLLFFLELQLLISLIMLPILIAWGLPISYMSIIGNLIFAPFLTIFIFTAALLFLSSCLGIPNSWIALALDQITAIWHYLLSFGTAHWLIGFPKYLLPISCILATTIIGLYSLQIFSQKQRLFVLILCCNLTLVAKTTLQPNFQHTIVKQGKQKFYVIKKNNKVYAFDCGALGARPSFQSWIEFTLIPNMVQTMGATHIDTLVLCKSNKRTQKATQALLQCLPTKQIINLQATIS